MNTIREIQALNKRELENGVAPSASWHADYRDTAYIYIGGLSFELTEGDVIAIFSQFGEPVHVNLIRDKDTGKSKGFAFLKYEDQRSTDLAVDNLGGATVLGRVLKVDHTRYKQRDDEVEETIGKAATNGNAGSGTEDVEDEAGSEVAERPMLKEEIELAELIRNHDEDDPMKEYLVQEKKEEVAKAFTRLKQGSTKHSEKKNVKRHHHHRHRSRRNGRNDQDESSREGRREGGWDREGDEYRSHREHRDGRERERSPRRDHRHHRDR